MPPPSYGIPDVTFKGASGKPISPAKMVGHALVVCFCPSDAAAAASELSDFAGHARDMCDVGALFLAVASKPEELRSILPASARSIPLAEDPGDAAWAAFGLLLDPQQRTQRGNGAVFLFGRGGSLQRAWPGIGHSDKIIAELKKRRPADAG